MNGSRIVLLEREAPGLCFVGLLLLLSACGSGEAERAAGGPSGPPAPERPGRVADDEDDVERPPWHVRHEVRVVEAGRPVEGAGVFSLVEGRLVGRTDAAGVASVWAPYDDTLLAMRGDGMDAVAGQALVGLEPPPHSITLRPPQVLRGRVSHDGAPVEGALVTLGFHPAFAIGSPPEQSVAERVAPDRRRDVVPWRRRCASPVADLRVAEPGGVVRTDTDGRFSLRARVDEALSVEACAPGLVAPSPWEPRAVDLSAGEPMELELLAVRRIEGQVVDAAGVPIEGARVEAVREGLMGGRGWIEEELTTDADGRFTHEAHPEHGIHFVVHVPGGPPSTHHAPPDADELRIRVAPSTPPDESSP